MRIWDFVIFPVNAVQGCTKILPHWVFNPTRMDTQVTIPECSIGRRVPVVGHQAVLSPGVVAISVLTVRPGQTSQFHKSPNWPDEWNEGYENPPS